MSNGIVDYAIEKTQLSTEVISEFNRYIQKANKSWVKYEQINAEGTKLQIIQNHQKQLSLGLPPTQSLGSTIKNAYADEKQNAELAGWLNNLKIWAIDGYKTIMGFRSFVTQGQIFKYNVLSANKAFSYELNEKHFTELLTGDLTTRSGWADFKGDLGSLLSLSVADPDSKKMRLSKGGEFKTNTQKDALYQYLFSREHPDTLSVENNRLYELYSQLKGSFEWKLTPSKEVVFPPGKKTFFFSNDRKKEVDDFIKNYLSSKSLANDNIRFYKTGDSIVQAENSASNQNELIENKLGGSAGISIRTIKFGIRSIVKAGKSKTGRSLASRLKKMFSYISPGTDSFARGIQEGAGIEARKAIDQTVSQLVSGGRFKR